MEKITIVAKGGGNTDEYLIRYIMRIQRKIKEIASDFSIPPEIRLHFEIRIDGTALPTDELLDFFKESLYIGFSQMFDRLLKDKYTLDKEALMNFIKENIESVQKPTEDN